MSDNNLKKRIILKSPINHIGLFPSGRFIIVSKTLRIYDSEYNLLEEILPIEAKTKEDFHQVEIIDDNNFIVAFESSIIFYIFKDNKYIYKNSLTPKTNDEVMKIIYRAERIYICFITGEINIIEKSNDEYQIKEKIELETTTYSFLLIENDNYLLIGGRKGLIFLDINNHYNQINVIKAPCLGRNSLVKLNEEIIITGGDFNRIIYVVNIKNKQIITRITNKTSTWGILVYNNYILTGGIDKIIRIFNVYDWIVKKAIENCHNSEIKGFIKFKDGKIGSYGIDGYLNIFENLI